MLNQEEHIIDALLRDGTSQESRSSVALSEDYVKIDERDIEDFLAFIHSFADRINFYNSSNQLDGQWQEFFQKISDKTKIDELLNNPANSQDPHLTLILAFLKMFDYAKNDLNQITGKHLDFYYEEVLQLDTKPAEPDKVHLIFELARNVEQHRLEKGKRLKAGKDENGKELLYETIREVVLNRAKIHSLKSVFIDKEDKYRAYAAPYANSEDGLGTELIIPEQGWKPFGENQTTLPTESQNMIDATIGFAIASPLFLLKEGERRIYLEFDIDIPADAAPGTPSNQVFSKAFNISLSGEKDWINLGALNTEIKDHPLGSSKIMVMELNLDTGMPAVLPFDPEILDGGFLTSWPLMKAELNPEAGAYEDLKDIYISGFTIQVEVDGVKDLIVQNDLNKLDPSKPFQPFGPQPVPGSTFYIGSEEVFQKRLDDISFNLLWADLPDDPNGFVGYYNGYTSVPATNSSHLASLAILDKGKWIPETFDAFDNFQLFQTQGSGLFMEEFNRETTATNKQRIKVPRDPNIPSFQQYNQIIKRGFVKLVLKDQVFGHKEFPELYLNKTIEKSKNSNPDTILLPNPPYTPTLQSISINYVSSEHIAMNNPNGLDQFFHIGPFGQAESSYNGSQSIVPQFEDEGYLYIGLESFDPPQNISMMFQIVEGSGDPEFSLEPTDIQWRYLSGNNWLKMSSLDVVVDTTQGFQKSGIVELTIGRDAKDNNTLMPAGNHWIRADVNEHVSAACKIVEIKAQAVEASFVLGDVEEISSNHFENPLKEGTISKLLIKDGSIKSISQPYTSFEGRGPEAETAFYTRAGERLKHKLRPNALWDYERMVLEAFPSIYKVKCLNHTKGGDNLVPGHVTLVAIQNLRKKNGVNVLEPRTDSITLENIRNYLMDYVSPFVHLNVENPVYEQILVHFKVGFYPGYDSGFYGKLLNEEIKKFLSPWAFEEGVDIVFGGKVYKSDILAFIENRDYVDYITDFKLYHVFSGPRRGGIGDMAIGIDFIVRPENPPGLGEMILEEDFVIGEDVELAFASDPRSILVSAQNHYITVLKSEEYVCQGVEYGGIGFMTIGLDFVVSP